MQAVTPVLAIQLRSDHSGSAIVILITHFGFTVNSQSNLLAQTVALFPLPTVPTFDAPYCHSTCLGWLPAPGVSRHIERQTAEGSVSRSVSPGDPESEPAVTSPSHFTTRRPGRTAQQDFPAAHRRPPLPSPSPRRRGRREIERRRERPHFNPRPTGTPDFPLLTEGGTHTHPSISTPISRGEKKTKKTFKSSSKTP